MKSMKYILAGAAGLLMLSVNAAGLICSDNTAVAGYIIEKPTDNTTINLDACNHDCAACGKCFSSLDAVNMENIATANNISEYKLTVN